jgi:hypothetical protein
MGLDDDRLTLYDEIAAHGTDFKLSRAVFARDEVQTIKEDATEFVKAYQADAISLEVVYLALQLGKVRRVQGGFGVRRNSVRGRRNAFAGTTSLAGRIFAFTAFNLGQPFLECLDPLATAFTSTCFSNDQRCQSYSSRSQITDTNVIHILQK